MVGNSNDRMMLSFNGMDGAVVKSTNTVHQHGLTRRARPSLVTSELPTSSFWIGGTVLKRERAKVVIDLRCVAWISRLPLCVDENLDAACAAEAVAQRVVGKVLRARLCDANLT